MKLQLTDTKYIYKGSTYKIGCHGPFYYRGCMKSQNLLFFIIFIVAKVLVEI